MKQKITNSQQLLVQGAVWQFGLKSDIMLWHCDSWKFELVCHPGCENRSDLLS